MKIGDLARLSTPDDADGKVVLITRIVERMGDADQWGYVGIVVGEAEEHVYLRRELKLLDD